MRELYIEFSQEGKTLLDFLRFGLSRARQAPLYYGHGTENAYDDIYALVMGSLCLPYSLEPVFLQACLTTQEKSLLAENLYQRIENRIPVPYLTKEALFCGLPFYVDSRVLIPRSPFAELIQERFAPWVKEESVHTILDLCTGSGCIAIACAYAFPEACVYASDISQDALDVACINCQKLEVEARVQLQLSDVFENIPLQKYDLIVANPPYVGEIEMATLPQEYTKEPRWALEAEEQGLAIVKKILARAAEYLSPEGVLVVEVGNSEELLVEAFSELPFTWLTLQNGGQGIFLLTAQDLGVLR